ncbi:MAG: GNAT family N-acetyltransferase [Pseudomonadota bacterium]
MTDMPFDLIVLGQEDAARLALIHQQSFDRPWSQPMFEDVLIRPTTLGLAAGDVGIGFQAFVLVSIVPPDAEILTLATAPNAQRLGLALHLIKAACLHLGQRGVETLFLEVAASNLPAQALYQKLGFVQRGKRPRYYRKPDGRRDDALILVRAVTGL